MHSAINETIRDTVLGPLLELTPTRTNTPPPAPQQSGNTQNALDFTLELDDIEGQIDQITSTAFNFETLEFRPGTLVLSRPDAVLDTLLPTARSTHNLVYRVNQLKNLAFELSSLQKDYGLSISDGAQPTDVSRCDTLLTTVNLTLDGLFSMAHGCYKERNERDNENGVEGIRTYRFVTPYSTGRFLPPVVMATTLLIAIIHTLMSVTRDNCNGILAILRAILRLAFNGQDLRTRSFVQANVDTIPLTLGTALIYLGLPTQLDVYVTCPACSSLYLFAESESVPERCTTTNLSGKHCKEPLFDTRHRGNRQWTQPTRQFSHQRLEVWLSKFLCRPEIEDLLEQAHPEPKGDSTTDFWGAPFLAEFPKGERSFFDAPKDELRLVFMIYHDFFNPYSNMIAGKKYSTGMVILVCLNLPPDIRYDRENVYLAAVIPGPSYTTEERPKLQPSEDQFNHFIRPIADNLSEHFDPGVWIARTAKYPRGRKVRSAAPIASMDVPASRDWGGLGSHAHNILCSFCLIVQAYIDVFKPNAFPRRDMEQHRLHVELWKSATTAKERADIWSKYGARHSEWLRFPWWDIGTGIPFAPMHWTKNILEKQLRINMGWSLTNPSGVPEPAKLKPITVLEKEWSQLAMKYSSGEELDLPELLLRHLCRERQIYETGLPSSRMVKDLNDLRKQQGVIDRHGQVVKPIPRLCVPERGPATSLSNPVTLAKAESYLSRAKKPSLLLNNSSLDDLFLLCTKFNLPYHVFNTKAQLASRLMDYYKNIRVELDEEHNPTPSKPVSWLGYGVLREVKDDMDETTIPSWMKTPPKNFASMSHGKIGAEEYKSLALISFTFTLIRLWGQAGTGALRERLDNFLHLTIAIRILHYQANSEADSQAFEHHIQVYLDSVKKLYPTCSITPTQHYGLHIPFFLRQFGPGAQFNENPAEMFVGMLQDIHTNFKHGDLGLTLHKEFNMAADLHALLQNQSVLDSIGEVDPSINQYLNNRFPSRRHLYSQGWTATHEANAFQLDDTAYGLHSSWANSKGLKPIARHQYICSKIQHGHLVYQPHTHSAGNSHILFRTHSAESSLPGRIESILVEHTHTLPANSKPRITILVRQFQPLSAADRFYDPYGQHPIVGRNGYNIAQLCYNEFNPGAFIIQPSDLVCHLAMYNYQDVEQKIKKPCVALLSLDLKHASPKLFNSN